MIHIITYDSSDHFTSSILQFSKNYFLIYLKIWCFYSTLKLFYDFVVQWCTPLGSCAQIYWKEIVLNYVPTGFIVFPFKPQVRSRNLNRFFVVWNRVLLLLLLLLLSHRSFLSWTHNGQNISPEKRTTGRANDVVIYQKYYANVIY